MNISSDNLILRNFFIRTVSIFTFVPVVTAKVILVVIFVSVFRCCRPTDFDFRIELLLHGIVSSETRIDRGKFIR